MGFIMPESKSKASRCRFCQKARNLLVILFSTLGILSALIFLPQWFKAVNDTGGALFEVEMAESVLKEGSYYINARLKMDFTPEVIEALESGVPLTLNIELKVWQQHDWVDKTIKESTQSFEYRYNALTGIHSMQHVSSGQKYSFDSREDALALLGNIHLAHLIKKEELDSSTHHKVAMRVLLDIWNLPAVLRPVASLSPQWRLESDWYGWMLN